MKFSKFLKNSFYGLMFFVGVFAFSVRTEAASGIQISPLTYEFNGKISSEITGTIIIKNTSNETLKYTLETENFNQISDDGAVTFEDAAESNKLTNSLANWITFNTSKTGELEAGKSNQIDFSIMIPENASPGGHYAAIFAKNSTAIDPDAQLQITNRVGSLIFVSIDGETVKSGEITETNYPKFIKSIGTSVFSYKFKNTGNIFYRSQGKIEITNLFGKKQTIDAGTHLVVDNNIRNFEGTWQNKFPLGYYTAKFISTDGDSNQVIKTVKFWALPWQLIIPIVLIIISIILLIRALLKKDKNISTTEFTINTTTYSSEPNNTENQNNDSFFK